MPPPPQYLSDLRWFNSQIPLLCPESGLYGDLHLWVFEVHFRGSGKNSVGRGKEVAGRCFVIPWGAGVTFSVLLS